MTVEKEQLQEKIERLQRQQQMIQQRQAGESPYSDGGPEKAALLTNAQRDYLLGKKEYRESVERQVRTRIRNRAAVSIQDLIALREFLPHDDWEEIRSETSEDEIDAAIEFLESIK